MLEAASAAIWGRHPLLGRHSPASDDIPSTSSLLLLLTPCLLRSGGRATAFLACALCVMLSLPVGSLRHIYTIFLKVKINDFFIGILCYFYLINNNSSISTLSFQSINYHIALKLTIIIINNPIYLCLLCLINNLEKDFSEKSNTI